MNKITKIFCSETFFACFLLAGFFKSQIQGSSIDITILFMVLSIVSVILRKLKRPVINKNGIDLLIIYFCFLSSLILIGLMVFHNEEALSKTLRFVLLTGWAFSGTIFLINSEESLIKFLNSLLALALIISGITLVKIYFAKRNGITYITGIFSKNYILLGRAVGIGIIIFLAIYLNKKDSKIIKLIKYIIFLFMASALAMSGARAPLIFFILTMLIFEITSFKYKKGGKLLISNRAKNILLLTAGVVLTLLIFMRDYLMPALGRFKSLLNISQDASASSRLDRISVAIQIWKDNIFFGSGLGGFATVYGSGEYPHNIFLEFSCELGIIGVFIFCMLLFISISRGIIIYKKRNIPFSDAQKAIIFCFIYLFLNANVSGDLNGNRVLFTFISLLYMLPSLKDKQALHEQNES